MRVIDCWEFLPLVVYGDRRRGPSSTPYRFLLEIVEASKAIPVQGPKTCANTSRPYDFNNTLPDIGSKVEHIRIRYIALGKNLDITTTVRENCAVSYR